MYFLNRLRGTYSYFAKVNAVLLGLIFGFLTNPYIGVAITVGYLLGESMGWGDWIGQQCGASLRCGEEGNKNGIKWIASKVRPCGTETYNKVALVIRGFYWWLPTLAPIMFVTDPLPILLAVIALSFGFQVSLDWAEGSGSIKWENAERIYGGMQDVVLVLILLALI